MTLVLSTSIIQMFAGIHTIVFMDEIIDSWVIQSLILNRTITPTRIVFGANFSIASICNLLDSNKITVEFIDLTNAAPLLTLLYRNRIEYYIRLRPKNPRSLFFVQIHDKFKNETLWNFQTPVRIKLNLFILASAQNWERGGSKSALKKLPQELIRMTARFLL